MDYNQIRSGHSSIPNEQVYSVIESTTTYQPQVSLVDDQTPHMSSDHLKIDNQKNSLEPQVALTNSNSQSSYDHQPAFNLGSLLDLHNQNYVGTYINSGFDTSESLEKQNSPKTDLDSRFVKTEHKESLNEISSSELMNELYDKHDNNKLLTVANKDTIIENQAFEDSNNHVLENSLKLSPDKNPDVNDADHLCKENPAILRDKHACEAAELYSCAGCRKQFKTICQLHHHIYTHGSDGSYFFSQSTKTAFPRYGMTCKETQTVNGAMNNLLNHRLIESEQNKLTDVTELENDLANEKKSKTEKVRRSSRKKSETWVKNMIKEIINTEEIKQPTKKKRLGKKKTPKSKKGKEKKQNTEEMEQLTDQTKAVLALNTKGDLNDKESEIMNVDINPEEIDNGDMQVKSEIDNEEWEELMKSLVEDQSDDDTKEKNKYESDYVADTDEWSNSSIDSDEEPKLFRKKREYVENMKIYRSKTNVSNNDNIDMKKSRPKKFKCDMCDNCFSTTVSLRFHMNRVHSEGSVKCKWCEKIVKTPKELSSHLRKCKKNETMVCFVCDTRFSSKFKLTDHINNHTKEDLVCKICSKSFPSLASLQAHINRHTHPKTIQCDQCGKAFGYQNELRKHKVYCNHEKPVQCPKCDKTFSTKYDLQHHSSVHEDIRPYVCHICGYTGKKLYYLRRHIRSHTGERPYSCDICGMAFHAYNGLNRHRKTHTDKKHCVCTYCGKSFTNNWNLKTHERQHTGDTPYKCQHCGQGFKQNVLVKLHIKTHHPHL